MVFPSFLPNAHPAFPCGWARRLFSPWRSLPLISTERQQVIGATNPSIFKNCQNLTNILPMVHNVQPNLFLRKRLELPLLFLKLGMRVCPSTALHSLRSRLLLPTQLPLSPSPSWATGTGTLTSGTLVSQGSYPSRKDFITTQKGKINKKDKHSQALLSLSKKILLVSNSSSTPCSPTLSASPTVTKSYRTGNKGGLGGRERLLGNLSTAPSSQGSWRSRSLNTFTYTPVLTFFISTAGAQPPPPPKSSRGLV